MPPVSERQRRAMEAAAHGHSTLGIPKVVASEFLGADLDPNAAIPVGMRRKVALDEGVEPQGHAAGILFVAPDGDVLLLRRSASEANFGGHWGLPGGGVNDGESPRNGACREASEEMAVDVDPETLKPMEVIQTPTGLAFHTFARAVPEKFVPFLDGEHGGYAWASLDKLPKPLHPAVDAMLRDRLGLADDMEPEDWKGLRDGFLRWTVEEEAEEDHDPLDGGATDSALSMALDRDSVRETDRDGRLRVAKTNISKANVCPYRGSEIPGWQNLGLSADKIYHLLRDPDELKKAAKSLNGVPLLIKHVPVSADDHQANFVVGSLGTDADFDGTYLTNSLFVNARAAIDGIESGRQKELSAGYHYTPDMTAGNFRGTPYDGVMRDIVFNHVALVEDGRAGPDVVVGDEALKEMVMKPTRFAAALLATTSAQIAPLIAMDAKVTLPKTLFAELTPANFKTKRAAYQDGIKAALQGKLRKGIAMDASMAGLAKAIDAFEELEKEDDKEVKDAEIEPLAGVDPPPAKEKAFDAEPIKAFLREKGMGEDDIEQVAGMLPQSAMDEDDDDTGKKKDDDDKVTKQAMDAAIKSACEATAKQVRETEQGIRSALAEVKPWVGELSSTLAFDSAASVHRHALKMIGVADHDKLHADALLPVLRAQPKPGAKPIDTVRANIAMDASSIDKAAKIAPGIAGISTI